MGAGNSVCYWLREKTAKGKCTHGPVAFSPRSTSVLLPALELSGLPGGKAWKSRGLCYWPRIRILIMSLRLHAIYKNKKEIPFSFFFFFFSYKIHCCMANLARNSRLFEWAYVLMWGMCLFIRAMDLGKKNHPYLHSSKGLQLSLGPCQIPHFLIQQECWTSTPWPSAALWLPASARGTAVRGPLWDEMALYLGAPALGWLRGKNVTVTEVRDPAAQDPHQSWQTYWQRDGWHPTADLGGLAFVT